MSIEKLSKWKTDYENELKRMNNNSLLGEVLDSAGGDDYDGCFTDRGQIKYNMAKAYLVERLTKIGFLN